MLRVCLWVVTAVVLVAGCSVPDGGAEGPSPSVAPVGPSGIVLPPRPRELRLDGVDPCELLTPVQRMELGLDGTPVASQETERYSAGPACAIRGFSPRAITVGFALAFDNGIDAITSPGAVEDQLVAVNILGFPAILGRPTSPDGCFVDVDVASGQFLDILFRDGGGAPRIPQEELCRDALIVAEQAIATLLAR